MSRPPNLVFEDDVQPAAEGPPPRFGDLTFEDDVLPQQVAPEIDTELTFEDDPIAQPVDDPNSVAGKVVQTFKTGVAGLAGATLGLARSVLETPRTATRILGALEEGWLGQPMTEDDPILASTPPEQRAEAVRRANEMRDFRNKWVNPYAFPKAVTNWLSEGGEIGGFRYGGFGTTADELGKSMEALPELFPSYRRLGVKGEEADAAGRALLEGNTELIKKVAMDPEAWSGFLAQGIPSLFAAWKSGGSIPFMAWLEGMEAAHTAAEFEKETGVRMTDAEFATATASVGATNAFLEKMGLDSILGKYGKTRIGQLITGFVGEGGTEALQTLTNNAAAFIYDPSLRDEAREAIDEGEWEPFLARMQQGVLPAMMGGTALGGTAASARIGLEAIANRNKTERLRSADVTDEQAAEAGLMEVNVTHDLLERVATGQPLNENEQYTVLKQGLGRFANDDRVVLVKAGLDKREELTPKMTGEHIVMEGDEFNVMPTVVEEMADDVDSRVTFSKKDTDRTVRFNKKRMDRGANYAATSDLNEAPLPTEAQMEAGNYRKGHVRMQGLELSIENPKGSVRQGKDWQQTMANHYGYIRGTVGKDKDHIDAFVGPNAYSEQVYVVNQHIDGKFDEHKVMLGFTSQEDAAAAYKANYPAGWKGMESIVPIGMDDFKAWLGSNRTKEPLVARKPRDEVQDLKPIAKISEVAPVSKEARAVASTSYQEQSKQGPFTTRDGRSVRMTNVGMKKARSHSADPNVLAVMPHIGALIENSVPIKTVNRTSTGPGDNIRAYHHYAGKVMIGGKHHFVKVTLRENKDGSVIFYDTDVTPGDQMLKPPKGKGFDLAAWWQQGLGIDHADTKPKFKSKPTRTNAGNGIERAELRAAISIVHRYFKGAPDLEVVQGFEDLPEHIRARVPKEEWGLVTGVYDQDALTETVYLVANNIESYQQGIETLMHEYVGHYGLRSVLGESYNEMMDRVYERFGTEVREAARVQGLDFTDLEQRRVASEEFIAYTAQRYLNKQPLAKKLLDLLRQFIEEIKRIVALATNKPTTMTERDLTQLIARAYDYVHNPSGYARAQRRGLRRNMENPVYFSNLFKLVNEDKAKAMAPAEWIRVLKAHVTNNRLKEEELKWSGLIEAIEGMDWREVIKILGGSQFTITDHAPQEVAAAWRAWNDADHKDTEASVAYQHILMDKGKSVITDENHPNYAEATELLNKSRAATTAMNEAEAAWMKYADQVPKKIPKEVILAQIQASGTEVTITKNGGPDESEDDPPNFEIDERHPDEEVGGDDSDDMMEAWSDYESNNFDEVMYNEQVVHVLRNGINNSRWARVSYDWDKVNIINDEGQPDYSDEADDLNDDELLELATDWYEENDTAEWERIRDKAHEYYSEAFSESNYHDFVRDWERENKKKTWYVGDYVVTYQGGSYNVFNNESGHEVGDYGSVRRAEEAMEDDWREDHPEHQGRGGKTRWRQYTLDNTRDYEEWLFRWKNPSTTLYTSSSHWGDTENILAHARFDVRKDRDGDDAIFIDEIQSDWHQDLRDEGERMSETARLRLEQEVRNWRNDYKRLLPDLEKDMLSWNLDLNEAATMKTAPGPMRELARDLLGDARERMKNEEIRIKNARTDYEQGVKLQVFKRHGWNEDESAENQSADWDGTTLLDMTIEVREILDAQPFDPTLERIEVPTFSPNHTTRILQKRKLENTWQTFVERLADLDTDDLTTTTGLSRRGATSMKLASVYAALAPILRDSKEHVLDERWGDLAGVLPEERRIGMGIQNPLIPADQEKQVEGRVEELVHIQLEIQEREQKLIQAASGVHAAPFGKTWQLLVIKAMIREAVDRGMNTLFMAPGEVHGVRWAGAVTADGVYWRVSKMERIKEDDHGRKILLKQDDPRFVAGEIIYDYEEVPAIEWSPSTGGIAQKVPPNKLSSVVGGDVAAIINAQIKEGVMNGNVRSSDVGRRMLFLPNGSRDTLTGGREIYNVITPNLINKFIKKYGAEMKLGFVKGEVPEEKGVKQLMQRRAAESPYSNYVIRKLTDEEKQHAVAGRTVNDAWFGAFGPQNTIEYDSLNTHLPAVESWLKRKIESHTMARGFEAWEIKITDKLREAAKTGFPLFMKKYPSAKLNKAMEWADKNIGPRGPSGVERMQRRVNNVMSISNKAAKLEQAFVDQFAGIKWALKETYGTELSAEKSGYKQAHFSTGVDSQIYAFMTHGVPVWKNGITAIKDGSKGFLEILEPVAAHIDEYYLWRAAVRAARLKKEGREHLFGDAEIEGLLELSTYHPEFITVAAEEAKWRGEFLDWAQGAGAIDPTTRQLWDNADYVPFFRLKADELGGSFTRTSGVGGRGIVDQFNPIKRLKGGTQPLGNLLENVIMNFSHIAATTMKNRAAALTIENLKDTGLVEPVKGSEFLQKERIDMGDLKRKLKAAGVDWKALDEEALYAMRQMWTVQPPSGDDIVSILVGGKKKYYHVKDELLFRSLTAINTSAFNSTFAKIMMAPFRGTKRFVTSMITLAADFIAANVVRDTVSSFIVSRHAHFPRFDRNLVGAYKAFTEDKEMVAMMATGAAMYAGYVNALDPAATSRAVKRSLRKAGFSRTLLNTPRKLLDVYLRLGSASENASRIGMAYIPAAKAGETDAEAAWQALDLMNFRKHGDNAVLQFLIQTVPFMNARIQGLVRAGQRFKEAPGITALKGMLLLAATLALWFKNKDDERYKELTDDDKDLYFHFWIGDEHYRLPKPFEVGMIFATAPERIMEYWLSNEDDAGKLALERLSFVFDQVFMLYDPTTIVPAPALVEPLIEVNLNHNFFFRAPIVPEYMQDIALVKPEQVYDDMTSPLMREVAQLSPQFLPSNMRNPMMLEHLATAYGGTLTSYAVMMADDLVRQAYDYPPRPKLMWSQMPVAGRFYRGTEPPRRTGYENILYEVRQNARAIDRAISQMEDRELQDEADAFLTEPSAYNSRVTNEQVMDAARDMEPNYNEIRRIRKEMSEIWLDENMSPQQKLDQLNQLYRDKANEARDAYEQRPGAAPPTGEIGQLIDNIRGLTPDKAVERLIADDKPATADLVASLPRTTSRTFAKVLDDA